MSGQQDGGERIMPRGVTTPPDDTMFLVSAVKGDSIPVAADWPVGRVGSRARRSL